MQRPLHSSSKAFTLVELITVMVIIGLVSALGSSFLVSAVNSYNEVQARSKIINRGRLVIEQIARQLRVSLPNSVRVSASGNCVEFMPLSAGVNYISDVADSENLAGTSSTVQTAPYTLTGGASHVSIGALTSGEIYSSGSPNSRVGIGTLGAGPTYTTVPLASSHRFIRNSVMRRLYIADDPLRFCLIGTSLFRYSNYTFSTSALTDADPGGDSDLMAQDVSTTGQAFVLSLGSEDVNTVLDIDLGFSMSGNQVNLRQEVLIRNVP